jgi:hypothetical protein
LASTFTRPHLYPKQHAAFFHGQRYGLTEASTKAGKTVAAISWILEKTFAGQISQNFWWVAPVSSQAEIAYTRIKNGLTHGSFRSQDSPTPRIYLPHGPVLWFKSGDNPDSLFGEDVYAAVVDEASRVKEESWYALRSTLTATQGPCNIIGNVKGRKNWFYRMARMAEKDGHAVNMHYAKITVLDAIAAGVIPQSEVEDAQRTLPEHVFRELYLAEPSDEGGNPFGGANIEACTGRLSDSPPVCFGVDLAKKQDWTVVIGLDNECRVCVFQRWQHVPWRESIDRIQAIVGEDIPVLVDSTGIGDPVLEEIQRDHGNFQGYQFSNISKQRLMEGLAVSIQSHEMVFPVGPIPLELQAFEYVSIPTGVRYQAVEGYNDDCVCALALARQQWATVAPAASLMQFYSSQAKVNLAQARRENEDTTPMGQAFVQRLSRAETFNNELTELYNQTLAEYQPEAITCQRCHKPVMGPARVTDGVWVWHEGCM